MDLFTWRSDRKRMRPTTREDKSNNTARKKCFPPFLFVLSGYMISSSHGGGAISVVS